MKCCSLLMALGSALLLSAPHAAEAPNTVAIEALSRLKGMDLEANPALKAAVLNVVKTTRGTPQFVELVRDFELKGEGPALLEYAIKNPSEAAGVDAINLLLAGEDAALVRKALASTNQGALVQALGNSTRPEAIALLTPFLGDTNAPVSTRQAVLLALTRTEPGASLVLEQARSGKLAADLTPGAEAALRQVRWQAIKDGAAKVFHSAAPPPTDELPIVAELVKRSGDPQRGRIVFERAEGGCAACHQVNGQGIDFGPNLSEIGTKLGKDALYTSILEPSAGISFGYEAWQVELADGEEAFGLLASETPEEISIKAQSGIVTRYAKSKIERREQMKSSIMPSGLHETMTRQELIDLVDYLSTLKKSENPKR